jgi:uncharacterized membrane protein YphA (DoxX/SURF4 family)
VVILRLALAAVLVTSGVAKLFDRSGSRSAVEGFGVPARLAGPVAGVLPVAEIMIAAALLLGPMSRFGAVAAALLLVVFGAIIALALARGRQVACHCFGVLSGSTAGPVTLARNLALSAVAAFVALAPDARYPGIGTWVSRLSAAQRVAFWLSLVIVVLSASALWALRELLRQQGRLMLRLDALEGSPDHGTGPAQTAPAFTVERWPTGELSLEGLRASGRPLVLVFSDPHCGPCAAAVPVVAAAQRAVVARLTVAVLSAGATPDSEAGWREHQLDLVGLDPDSAVAQRFGVMGSPAAVLISSDGRIATAPVYGVQRISDLVSFAAGPETGTGVGDNNRDPRLIAVSGKDDDRVGA